MTYYCIYHHRLCSFIYYYHIVVFTGFVTIGQQQPPPGYRRFDVDPLFSDSSGEFVVGRARKSEPPQSAFLEVPADPSSGHRSHLVPKGIYHYSDREDEVHGDLRLPDFSKPWNVLESLFNADSGYKTKDNRMNGIYIPMPFGMEPINIQVLTENVDGTSIGSAVGTDAMHSMDEESKMPEHRALHLAKDACKSYDDDRQRCDEALKRYYRVRRRIRQQRLVDRDDTSSLSRSLIDVLMPQLSAHVDRQLNIDGDDQPRTLGVARNTITDRDGIGVIIGFPGFEPIYVGGTLNNDKNDAFNVGIGGGGGHQAT